MFQLNTSFARFELLTDMVMKIYIFWDIMPCSTSNVNWRFGGTYRLHLHSRRISQARTHHACYLLRACSFIPLPWTRRRYAPPMHCLNFKGLHGIISQKIEAFSSLFLYVTTQQLKSHFMIMMMIIITQFFIIYLPSQQLQGKLQSQHSVDTSNLTFSCQVANILSLGFRYCSSIDLRFHTACSCR
jgi:hypothetical protein